MDTTPVPSNTPASPVGPLIGSIIIIVVVSLGGLYFWADHLDKEAKIRMDAQLQKQELAHASSTDDLPSIEADLKKEDIGKLKTQIKTIPVTK